MLRIQTHFFFSLFIEKWNVRIPMNQQFYFTPCFLGRITSKTLTSHYILYWHSSLKWYSKHQICFCILIRPRPSSSTNNVILTIVLRTSFFDPLNNLFVYFDFCLQVTRITESSTLQSSMDIVLPSSFARLSKPTSGLILVLSKTAMDSRV